MKTNSDGLHPHQFVFRIGEKDSKHSIRFIVENENENKKFTVVLRQDDMETEFTTNEETTNLLSSFLQNCF